MLKGEGMNKAQRTKTEREVKLLAKDILVLKVEMEGMLKAYDDSRAKLAGMQSKLTNLQQYLNAPQI